MWPPNSRRIAESRRFAKSSWSRELKRAKSAVASTGTGTPASTAALIVQRPSPESATSPRKPSRPGLRARAALVRASSHERTTLPWRHSSAIAARSRAYAGGARSGVRLAQQVEAFGIGGHEAVLDAVVHHLDEVAGAALAAVQIAVRGGAAALRRLGAPGRKRREQRREPRRGGCVAADHEAVAVLAAEHSAADTDVEVVQAARAERGRAADVVDEMRVAAVDQGVAGGEPRRERVDDAVDGSGRDHDPDRARRSEQADELFERRGDGEALTAQRLRVGAVPRITDALVTGLEPPPRHVRAH